MNLFKAYIIDAKAEMLLREVMVVGKTESDAASLLSLTDAERALKRRDQLEIMWDEIGSFESRRVKRIIIEKDEEE